MFGKTNTKGVSLTHENSSTSNPTITTNINIRNSNADINSESDGKDLNVHYNSPYNDIQEQSMDLQSELLFLKAILNIYMNQKLYFSGKYIVCTPDELINLIKLLTNSEQVEIETEPIEVSCLGNPKLPYSKIINIWILKDNQRSIFKYSYSQFLTLFDECKVSLKVVRTIDL